MQDKQPAASVEVGNSDKLNAGWRWTWLFSDSFAVFVLAAVNVICFSNAMGCYFLADDFLHISLLHKTLDTHPESLLPQLNVLFQIPGVQLFVRPVVELSMALDYILWRTNSFGYHITNLTLQIVSSLCVFWITRRLLKDADRRQGQIAALLAGLLFATFPLHSEVVAWIVGRNEGLCGAFYLLSLWLFLKHYQDRSRSALVGSLCCFAVSLLSKEMAISLPFIIAMYLLIFDNASGGSLIQALKESMRRSFAYWLVLLGYLAVRWILLGTVVGGYVDSLGFVLNHSWWMRMTPESFMPLLYPINAAVVSPQGRLSQALRCLYLLVGVSLLLRSSRQPWTLWLGKKMLFAVGFLLISIAPALQSWYISPELIGGRYAYIPSAPLSILLIMIMFPVGQAGACAQTPNIRRLGQAMLGLPVAFMCVFGVITYRNNEAWVSTGREVHALQGEIIAALSRIAGPKKLVILNLPQTMQGAHMFYTFEEVQQLVQPPLIKSDLSQSLGSLEPRFLGERDLLNLSRLKEMVKSGNYNLFFWNATTMRLEPCCLGPGMAWCAEGRGDDPVIALLKQESARSSGIDYTRSTYSIRPSSLAPGFQFLEVKSVASQISSWNGFTSDAPRLHLTWEPSRTELFGPPAHIAQQLYGDGRPHTYFLAVGEHDSWSLLDKIEKLHITINGGANSARILSVRAVKGESLIPELRIDEATGYDRGDGMHTVRGGSAALTYDASHVPQAAQAIVEISKCYHQFELSANTYRESEPSPQAFAHIRLAKLSSTYRLPLGMLPSAGWYQVRLAAAGLDGRVVGYFSDPVYMKVSGEQVSRAGRL